MSNRTRNRRSRVGPRPGDFPLGSLKSRAAARAVQQALSVEAQQQQAVLFGNMTPLEQAFCEMVKGPGAQAVMLYMVRTAIIPKCKIFGWPVPTPEEVRHKRQVSEEVEKLEQEPAIQGEVTFLSKNALREMAEERLLRENQRAAQTASTTARAAEPAD
jgi:hypothetical protein